MLGLGSVANRGKRGARNDLSPPNANTSAQRNENLHLTMDLLLNGVVDEMPFLQLPI